VVTSALQATRQALLRQAEFEAAALDMLTDRLWLKIGFLWFQRSA
jgi:hypothetical protein